MSSGIAITNTNKVLDPVKCLENVIANYLDQSMQRKLMEDFPEYFELIRKPRTTTPEEIEEIIRNHQG